MPQLSLHIRPLVKKQFVLFSVFVFIVSNLNAQQNSFLNREWGLNFEKENNKIIHKDSLNEFGSLAPYTSFKPFIVPIQRTAKNKSRSYLRRKFTNENLIIINDTADDFYLTIDPLFNFEGGMDLADNSREKLIKNTRGVLVRGAFGKKLCFESSFYENQAIYPQYIDNYIASTTIYSPETAIVPGQGRAKPYHTNGYDFAMASAYISYSPSKLINIQAGHGKHFIGDGYRSLLLSDNSHNYPYARITTSIKKFQYTNLYTVFMNMTDGGVKTPPNVERLFQKKIGNFQLLNYTFFNRIQLGLFQGMVWQPSDTLNKQHLNFNTFDPVIGVNSAVYGLHDNNNIFLGSTFKLKITNAVSVYAQYMLDDIKWRSDTTNVHKKYGYQIGFKYFNFLGVKNLHLQVEYNKVSPYSYSASKPEFSYTHFNQPLAHPMGANFNEVVGFFNYRKNKFFVQLKINYAIKGVDSSNCNFGGNVFMKDNSFSSSQNLNSIAVAQGLKTTISYQDFQFGYLINPVTNFNIVCGVLNRYSKNSISVEHTEVFYFGFRTSLANFYYDF